MASAKGVPTVALLSKSSTVSQADLEAYVAPYQAFVDDWLVKWYPTAGATIVAPQNGEKPAGAWPIYFEEHLNQPGAAGYHSDSRHQPVAYIDVNQGPMFTGSHELAEMLVDPGGNSLYNAPSPDPADDGKEVQILDEVCDPCEDDSFGIEVGGVALSDFITPAFGNGTNGPYDAAGKLTSAREVAINGYISWVDGDEVKQATNFTGQGFQVRVLGQADAPKGEGKSLREWVDEQTRNFVVEHGIKLRRSR